MLGEYQIYDSDAHVLLSPCMWESLPAKYNARRPRPVFMGEESELGRYNTGWFVDGKVLPHSVGPGAQPANTRRAVMEVFGAAIDRRGFSVGSLDLSDPHARLTDMDRLGLDVQFMFPTTLYAHFTSDAGFEAALYRSYNRYIGNQCKQNSKRLKWAGLLPLRDPTEAILAIEEMKLLGASAAVVYGTAGNCLLSNPKFSAIWDCFYSTGLPLCVHMGMSYPPLEQLSQSILDAHVLGMSLPAQLAFFAKGEVGKGVREQTHYALQRVKTILEAGGTSLDNVLTVTTHLTKREDLAAYNEEYAKFFPTNKPARTTVEVMLNAPDLLVEITVTACIPD